MGAPIVLGLRWSYTQKYKVSHQETIFPKHKHVTSLNIGKTYSETKLYVHLRSN